MQIFKTKWLARFARQERIPDESLKDAVDRASRGLIDADLGGGLIKQRVARLGKGRSGGYRLILAYRAEDRAVFLLGFAKNDRENIDPDELLELRLIGCNWLDAPPEKIDEAIKMRILLELDDDHKKV